VRSATDLKKHRKGRGITLAIVAVAIIAVAPLLHAGGEAESDDQALLERLRSLGYVEQVSSDPDPGRAGVTLHDANRAYPGINVYCSVQSKHVRFLDMNGAVLHTITLPEAGVGRDCLLVPTGDGDFLALSWPILVRIGWDSEVRWISREGHHHDVALDGTGKIYTLSEKPGFLPQGPARIPIRDHSVLILDENGRRVREIELSPLFDGDIPSWRIAWLQRLLRRPEPNASPYEMASRVYHPNTIQVLDRDAGPGRPGNLLLCVRNLDLVAIVDPDRPAVVWRWGSEELDRPHHPTVLANGNLLIFDNGMGRRWSRVIEVAPATERIVWAYQGDPRESFFSRTRGSSQGLPNGNVLITESNKGRVFEVTRGGEVVWEFWNPEQTEDGVRRQIYRMQRFDPDRLGLPRNPGVVHRSLGSEPEDLVPADRVEPVEPRERIEHSPHVEEPEGGRLR
jgi:hypothetical protein